MKASSYKILLGLLTFYFTDLLILMFLMLGYLFKIQHIPLILTNLYLKIK